MMEDDEDLEFLRGLREEFLEECNESLENLESMMLNYESSSNEELLISFMRTLHSMKGSARAVDLHTMGQVIHQMESNCVNKVDNLVELTLASIDNLRSYADIMKDLREDDGETFIKSVLVKMGS